MRVLKLDTISTFHPYNNRVLVKFLSNSSNEYTSSSESKIIVVRNKVNQRRENSIGKVILVPKEAQINLIKFNPSELLNQVIIYDTDSIEYQIQTPNDLYHLIRIPDIISILEEDK